MISVYPATIYYVKPILGLIKKKHDKIFYNMATNNNVKWVYVEWIAQFQDYLWID